MRFSSLASAVSAIALSTALTLLAAGSAEAANYGTIPGSTVTFEDVRDQNGLFGAPTGSGDTLDFSPNTFEVECPNNCPAPLSVEDTLTLQIRAESGFFIEELVLTEAGDTELSSLLGALAVTTVSAAVFIDIFEIDGVAINQINAQAEMVFTSDGDYRSDQEGYGLSLWNGFLSVDLNQIIADTGATGRATLVELNLNNILTAGALDGASARIEKKDVDGLAITVIPEPGAALLLGLGLAGLASIRRSSMS